MSAFNKWILYILFLFLSPFLRLTLTFPGFFLRSWVPPILQIQYVTRFQSFRRAEAVSVLETVWSFPGFGWFGTQPCRPAGAVCTQQQCTDRLTVVLLNGCNFLYFRSDYRKKSNLCRIETILQRLTFQFDRARFHRETSANFGGKVK